MSAKPTPVSQNSFLFPFKWKFPNLPGGGQANVAVFQQRLEQVLLPGGIAWRRNPYQINDPDDYNEYTYFYDFVREILYDHGDDSPRSSIREEDLLRHFDIPLDLPPGQRSPHRYRIHYLHPEKKDAAGRPLAACYELDLDFLALNVYRNGVAVLVIQASNYDAEHTPDDILRINDLGRRIFPPFLFGDAPKTKEETWQVSPGGSLPMKIEILIQQGAQEHIWGENGLPARAKAPRPISDYQFQPVELPHLITQLLGGPDQLLVSDGPDPSLSSKDLLQIYPLVDDRMHLISTYRNEEIMQKAMYLPTSEERYTQVDHHPMARFGKITGPPEQAYGFLQDKDASDFWYRYLFVDMPGEWDKGVKNKLMQERLILESSYDRWIESGTLFGATRYSMVCLLGAQVPDFIFTHMRTMYYKMAELLLVQRATILRFSDEVTELTTAQREEDPKLADDIRALYRRYIQFVNKIHFREVTAQEQGIELYQLMYDKMRIERDVKELDQEIAELHSYATMLEENRRNRRLEWLTIVGAVLLLPTFISGFFGMNVFNDDLQAYSKGDYVYITSLILCVAALTFGSLFAFFKSNRSRLSHRRLLRMLAGVLGLGALGLTAYLLFYPLQRPVRQSIQETSSLSEPAAFSSLPVSPPRPTP